ncbi:MAG TPA: hypothetical protein VI815_02655 [Candidatus Nanoarchaeia archaeon]|nr:hypothetical protein [Candidatus Nanoarchaeia archaeon]
MKTRKQIFMEIAIIVFIIIVIFSFFGTTFQYREWYHNTSASITNTHIINTGKFNDELYRVMDFQTGKIIYVIANSSNGSISIAVTDMRQK